MVFVNIFIAQSYERVNSKFDVVYLQWVRFTYGVEMIYILMEYSVVADL